MGFRLRKSFTIAPGLRLTLSKRGIGLSAGAGPFRYSVHSSGRRTFSARTGIPGLTYIENLPRAGSSPEVPFTPEDDLLAATADEPVSFASPGEKALYEAMKADDVQAIRAVGEEHVEYRLLSDSIVGLMLLSEDEATSESLLQRAFDDGGDPARDQFLRKHDGIKFTLNVNIAPGVSADLPFGRATVGLALAELRQRRGDLDGSIHVVEQLHRSSWGPDVSLKDLYAALGRSDDVIAFTAVSLADLYAAAGRFDDVIALTDSVVNLDDASAVLLTFRGMAFRHKGLYEAAHESLKQALKSRSRHMSIQHLALFERAANYAARGKKAMARKDLERILAENSMYPGVAEALAALSPERS